MKVGIDLGGSHIAIGVVNNNGTLIEKVEKRLTSIDKKDIKTTIENYIMEHVKRLSKKYEITNLGIAIPGTVKNDTIIKSVNLGIEQYNIVKNLKEKIKLPIKIMNDAKCAAIAENKYGCLKSYKRSVFLTLGTGIGGAVIINNKLLDTGDLPGCEFGHMIIEKDGLQCNCGNLGCWEKYASMTAFKDNIRRELNLSEKITGKEILNIIRKNKEKGQDCQKIDKIINTYIEYLSLGIANLVNIMEPEVIGIGGSFVFFQELFLEKLENEILNKKLLFNTRKELKIETAILGNDAGIIGAV